MSETLQQQPSKEQQDQAIKLHFLNELSKNYQEFILKFIHLPVQNHPRIEALRAFDTGFLWAKESINTMLLAPAPQPAEAELKPVSDATSDTDAA